MSGYQELSVWRRSLVLAKTIHQITDTFPQRHQYELASQMRRASISIMSNIAEGCRRGRNEEAHFIRIAQGSAAELESQAMLCKELGFIRNDMWEELHDIIDHISRELYRYRQSLFRGQ